MMRLAVMMFLSGALALAQGMGGCCQKMSAHHASAQTTIVGTVTENTQDGCCGMGTQLTVKTADHTMSVVLGPASFIESKGFSFAKGDSVEVTGLNMPLHGADRFMASQVVKDGKTLLLRDKNGKPAWGGSMMCNMDHDHDHGHHHDLEHHH